MAFQGAQFARASIGLLNASGYTTAFSAVNEQAALPVPADSCEPLSLMISTTSPANRREATTVAFATRPVVANTQSVPRYTVFDVVIATVSSMISFDARMLEIWSAVTAAMVRSS